MRLAIVLLPFTCSAQPKTLEFRGMRPGMTKEALAEVIANIAKDQGSKGTLECIPAAQHTLCMWGLYGAMLSGNQVFDVTYKIPLFETLSPGSSRRSRRNTVNRPSSTGPTGTA